MSVAYNVDAGNGITDKHRIVKESAVSHLFSESQQCRIPGIGIGVRRGNCEVAVRVQSAAGKQLLYAF